MIAAWTTLLGMCVAVLVYVGMSSHHHTTYEAPQDGLTWAILIVPPKCLHYKTAQINYSLSLKSTWEATMHEARKRYPNLGAC